MPVLIWAFKYMYSVDNANACMHTAPTKYSPITFRLAEEIAKEGNLLGRYYASTMLAMQLNEVLQHKGQYEEDTGR